MNDKRKKQLAELERQIKEMHAAGNQEGEAMARSQKALLLALSGRLDAAAKEVAKVGTLAAGQEQVDVLAQAHMAQGKALARQPGQRESAIEALKKAAALYETLAQYPQAADALQELAGLFVATGKTSKAIDQLNKAIALLEGEEDESKRLVDLYRARAVCHLLEEDREATTADLDRALAVAQESGQQQLLLQVRIQRQLLQDEVSADSLDSLRQKAQQWGNLPAVSDVQLQQAVAALQNSRFQQALELAQSARNVARDADDLYNPVRYLSASLVMAEAHELMGDRPGVLADLLTCRTYLSHRLGQEVGKQMDTILDALSQRWGKTAMAEAVTAYQKRAQEEGPFPI